MYVSAPEGAGSTPGLDLPLLFSTSDPAAAERLGAPMLGRHRYGPEEGAGPAFRATLHALVLGPVTVARLAVDGATQVELNGSAPRFLVVAPWRGRIAARCGSRAFEMAPDRALVLQPGRPSSTRCTAGAAVLVIGIEKQALLVHLCRLLGRSLHRPLVFDPELDLGAGTSSRWNLAVAMLHAELADEGSLLRAGTGGRQMEEFLMSSLLYGHRSSYSSELCDPGGRAERRATRVGKEFIEQALPERLTVAAVASAAGVSPRTLQAAFRSEMRTTPTAYIRSCRLDRVRADLTAVSAMRRTTVTEIATRWGFTHLGRFATEYRDRFGESPSETLRRPSPVP